MRIPGRAERRLLFASVAFSLVAGEFLLRAATPAPSAPSTNVLMLSSSYYQLDDAGAIRHGPNDRLRILAMYDEAVEFDSTLPSNDLGFIDHRNYVLAPDGRLASRRYAFVGDSFTEGFGGDPWVPRLRDWLQASGRDVEIYNLGVAGAGFQQFDRLLRSVADELSFTDVVILVISNDFYRPIWTPVTSSDGLRLCRGERATGCAARQPIGLIGSHDSKGEAVERARQMSRALVADPDADTEPLWRRAARQSRLLTLGWRTPRRIYERFWRAESVPDPGDMEDPRQLEANLSALSAIRSRHGATVQLIHLPEKQEVAAGRYKLDVESQVERLGVPYFAALTRCEWAMSMFYPRDGHPNAQGYENISSCVANHLFR